MTDQYERVEWCLHAALAELDSYLGQLGILQRVATEKELADLVPHIGNERKFATSSRVAVRLPAP
eukprot:6251785-Heterocapsa_arctica.AAC.1